TTTTIPTTTAPRRRRWRRSQPEPGSAQWVRVEEGADLRHQHLVPVLQHVVARVVERVHLRLRQVGAEALEEVPVEHEILQAPADEGGAVGEGRQRLA